MVSHKMKGKMGMNNNKRNVFLRNTIKIIMIPIVLVVAFFLQSCVVSQIQRTQYLSDPSNYISISGAAKVIGYLDDKKRLVIELDTTNPKLDGNLFVLDGSNLIIVQNNGIDSLLQVGDEIELITAPKYFWDGYEYPIAALESNGIVFRDFATGFNNIQH